MNANTARKIERRLHHGITVADLIQELECMDPAAIVGFACDYGDHTMQFLPVGNVEEMGGENLYDTAYSHSELALREPDEEDDEDEVGEEGEEKEAEDKAELPRIVVFR